MHQSWRVCGCVFFFFVLFLVYYRDSGEKSFRDIGDDDTNGKDNRDNDAQFQNDANDAKDEAQADGNHRDDFNEATNFLFLFWFVSLMPKKKNKEIKKKWRTHNRERSFLGSCVGSKVRNVSNFGVVASSKDDSESFTAFDESGKEGQVVRLQIVFVRAEGRASLRL